MSKIPSKIWPYFTNRALGPIRKRGVLPRLARAFLLFAAGSLSAQSAQMQGRETTANGYTLIPDVPYLEPNRAEKLDIYLPLDHWTRPRPVVLYIHGGGWTQGDKAWGVEKPSCEALVRSGYAVVCINYQLNRPGDCDAFPQNIFDCKSALRFIRKEAAGYGFDPERVAVAGGSAGGHLALLLAYTPEVEELNRGALYPQYPARVCCVIDLFGIADVRTWGHRAFVSETTDPVERKRLLNLASPITHVGARSVPTLVIHGDMDHVVPFSQAQALVERLAATGVPHRFIPVAGGAHAFPFIPHPRNKKTDLMPVVTAFLREHLNSPQP
jgi:acetyl esterase/lipase